MNISAITFIVIIIILIAMYIIEKRKLSIERLVLTAVFSALASVGRILFIPVASVLASSFFIIMCGVLLGASEGFLCGVGCAFVSNMVMSQGMWTPWQMLSWGLMGVTASILPELIKKNRLLLSIFGFLWGFIYGWITNIWSVGVFLEGGGFIKMYLSSCVLSFFFDLRHAVSNFILLFFLSNPFSKMITRVKKKYLE